MTVMAIDMFASEYGNHTFVPRFTSISKCVLVHINEVRH